tara:strand:- start:43 stop:372 length:330 start_codon:yes stop_codon:yes gene_type:complete
MQDLIDELRRENTQLRSELKQSQDNNAVLRAGLSRIHNDIGNLSGAKTENGKIDAGDLTTKNVGNILSNPHKYKLKQSEHSFLRDIEGNESISVKQLEWLTKIMNRVKN